MEYRLILAEEAEGRVANLFRTTSSRRISLVCERCADNWGFLTTYDVHSELKIPFMSPFPVAIICKFLYPSQILVNSRALFAKSAAKTVHKQSIG